MEAKPNRSYEDFDPVCKWRGDEARDTLEVHLPGFRREQVKVQVKHLDFILISGGRPLDGTRWKRFNKEVELPKFCNVDAIHANFQQSILSVVMPKKITQKEEIEYEHDEEIEEKEEEEETGHRYLEFRGWSIRELEGKPRRHDHHHHHDAADHINAADENDDDHHFPEFWELDSSAGLPPETTGDVAFKLMIVVILILVMASYVTDMCKSIMAHYFHN